MAGSGATGSPAGPSRRSFLASAGVLLAGLAACRSNDGDGDDRRAGADGGEDGDGPTASYRYGDHANQVVDLYLPDGDGPWPVVALLHGGFWRAGFDRGLMEPLARDLVAGGYAAWNIDYRSSADEGGGWPGTFEDVADALDRLAEVAGEHALDLERVITVGHSAGGTLSLWAAARGDFAEGVPGADPEVTVCGAVSLAGVLNLVAAWYEDLGMGAVDALMGGGPRDDRAIYRQASPEDLVPFGVPQLVVHGTGDPIVPPAQSIAYEAKASEAGDPVELLLLDGADHFDVIDPDGKPWAAVTSRLGGLCE